MPGECSESGQSSLAVCARVCHEVAAKKIALSQVMVCREVMPYQENLAGPLVLDLRVDKQVPRKFNR